MRDLLYSWQDHMSAIPAEKFRLCLISSIIRLTFYPAGTESGTLPSARLPCG
ncbi:hypothetical protein Sant_0076 [Sodalis praecaptivus]|uniref:Uncharacterized protein n=1 Tax=Sodalis praecaptivus TaxID=1239307 RepID=W0HSS0_9GAMM|nr:hypothetical protein Sant_0076 [Sodalis praecaptivus]